MPTYFAHEKIAVADAVGQFTTATYAPSTGSASLATCQVRGGSLVLLSDGQSPADSDDGIVYADGDIFDIAGVDNISQTRFKKVTDTPKLTAMYGK